MDITPLPPGEVEPAAVARRLIFRFREALLVPLIDLTARGAGGSDERFELPVWLSTHQALVSNHEGRHAGDTQLACPLPIGIDSRAVLTVFQNLSCHVRGQADLFSDDHQAIDLRKIYIVHEVRVKKGVVNLLSSRLCLSPLRQFLCQATVVVIVRLP